MKNIKLTVLMVAFGLLIQVQTSFAQGDCAAADTHLAKGKSLIEQSKFKEAQAELTIYVACNPQKFDGYSQRARAEVLANDFNAALVDANKALALNPQDANAFNVHGLVNKTNKNYEAAIKDFTDAIRLEPANPKAYFNRGVSYTETKDLEKAMLDFNKAIELAPTFPRSYVQRGLLNFSMQNWAAAEKDFSQAIRLGENTAFIYMNRGAANHNLGNYDQSIADNRKALELDPNNAAAKTNLELSLARQTSKVQPTDANPTADALIKSLQECDAKGNYACVVQLGKKAIELYPNNKDFYFYRGKGFLALNKFDDGIADETKAIAIFPKYPEAFYLRGFAYEHIYNYDKAVADFRKALDIKPDFNEAKTFLESIIANEPKGSPTPDDLTKLISDCEAKNNYACVAHLGSKGIEFFPSDARFYLARGRSLGNLERYDESLVYLSKAIEINPKYDEALTLRAIIYELAGKYDKAVDDYRTRVQNAPIDENYLVMGKAVNRIAIEKMKCGADGSTAVKSDCVAKLNEAIDVLTKAIKQTPESSATAFMFLGERAISYRTLVKLGIDKTKEAKADEDKFLANLAKTADALNNKLDDVLKVQTEILKFSDQIVACQNKKDYACMVEIATTGLKKYPDTNELLFSRGAGYSHLEKYDDAIADFTKALEVNPKSADALNLRGVAYFNKNDFERSIADLRKAIEIKPDFDLAKKNLEVVIAKQASNALIKSIEDCDAKADYACIMQLAGKGIELYPANEYFPYYRGTGFIGLKKYDEAIADETKAIAMYPKFPDALRARGLTYAAIQNYDLAEADFKKVLEFNPGNKDVITMLGETIPALKYNQYVARYNQADKEFNGQVKLLNTVIHQVPENLTNICRAMNDESSAYKIVETDAEKIVQLLNSGGLDKLPEYKKEAQGLDINKTREGRTEINHLATTFGCRLN